MFSEVIHRITVSEIIVSVLMFLIIRGIVWCLKQGEHLAEKEFKKEAHRLFHKHVWGRHGGSPQTCTHPDCTIVAVDLTELAL